MTTSLSRTGTVSRRTFIQAAGIGYAAFATSSGWAAQSPADRIRFAVIGINHEHLFRMTKCVKDGGGKLAMVYAENPETQLAEKFFSENPQVVRARNEAEVLEAPDIQLVISTAPPAERSKVGVRVMRAGKDFLADKGGFLNLESLEEARKVQAETKRMYIISYSERTLDRPTVKAGELVAAGAVGRVVHTSGIGPHGLLSNPREPWFWTRAGKGGILADVGTHQADQFLYFTGSTTGEVVSAHTANRENPEHPEFEDFGEVVFKGDRGTGFASVDYYRGKSLGARLTIIGTEGILEIAKGANYIDLNNREGKRRVEVESQMVCPFGKQLVDDVLNRTQTAMSQAHSFLASELAVRAQIAAKPLT